jgi:hypothetical protein
MSAMSTSIVDVSVVGGVIGRCRRLDVGVGRHDPTGLECIDLVGQELQAEQCAGHQPLVGRVAEVAHRGLGGQLVDPLSDGHGSQVTVRGPRPAQ